MAAKKIKSGLVITIILILAGLAGSYFIGSKLSVPDNSEIEKLISDLRSDVDAQAKLIKSNKKLGGLNKSGIDNSVRKITTLNSSVLRDSMAARRKATSTAIEMTYINKAFGLKWVTRPGDGHKYCLIPFPLPWHMAQDFANKVGGDLVVINDENENKWVTDTFGSDTEFWIGLTDEVDEGKWLWVNGLDSVYTNWATPEPDNYRKMQHHAIINKQSARGAMQAGKWNDIEGNEIRIGIIEAGR